MPTHYGKKMGSKVGTKGSKGLKGCGISPSVHSTEGQLKPGRGKRGGQKATKGY